MTNQVQMSTSSTSSIAQQLINLAVLRNGTHVAMATSAQSCINDAAKQLDAGNAESACRWALRSLSYSIGILSPEYADSLSLCNSAQSDAFFVKAA